MRLTRRPDQRGFVLVTMGIAAFALLGTLGLAVDLGRTFIAKNETQAFVDAAAIAAVTHLNGTTAGITRAQLAVANSTNSWNLHTTSVSNYTVDFATTATGPWVSSPNPALNYVFARVQATVPLKLYFLPGIVNQNSQNVISLAIAGQVLENTFGRGVGPFTAIAPDPSQPDDFGFEVGEEYTIQWPQYNGSRHNCNAATPEQCFVRPPCDGEDEATGTLNRVRENWGSSVNGYWGSNSSSEIRSFILDLLQTQPLTVGGTIPMINGNRNMEGIALDERVNQDFELSTNVVPEYMASTIRNGRRLLPLPVIVPAPDGMATVVGFGAFLLVAQGTPSNYYRGGNGNDPFCAIYAGPYVQGASSTGGSSQTGSYRIKLVY